MPFAFPQFPFPHCAEGWFGPTRFYSWLSGRRVIMLFRSHPHSTPPAPFVLSYDDRLISVCLYSSFTAFFDHFGSLTPLQKGYVVNGQTAGAYIANDFRPPLPPRGRSHCFSFVILLLSATLFATRFPWSVKAQRGRPRVTGRCAMRPPHSWEDS